MATQAHFNLQFPSCHRKSPFVTLKSGFFLPKMFQFIEFSYKTGFVLECSSVVTSSEKNLASKAKNQSLFLSRRNQSFFPFPESFSLNISGVYTLWEVLLDIWFTLTVCIWKVRFFFVCPKFQFGICKLSEWGWSMKVKQTCLYHSRLLCGFGRRKKKIIYTWKRKKEEEKKLWSIVNFQYENVACKTKSM